MKKGNVSVFIPHIGCPCRCSFCDQKAISGEAKAPTAGEVDSLLAGALSRAKEPQEMEIAFFGGSFTAIDRGYMTALLDTAQKYLGENGFGGIRISTRPDCIDREVLSLLKKAGVTAIELGAQSMDDGVLFLNGRGHTAQDVRKAAALIREYGFQLGLQMMTGLYGDTDAGALRTAREFALLHPAGVRIYPTVVLRGTKLAALCREGRYHPPGVRETVPLCRELLRLFDRAGIPVLRLGLHASREVEENWIAGTYHPALRELCEGEDFFCRLRSALLGLMPGSYCVTVHPRDHSRAAGQKKANLSRLAALGYQVHIRTDPDIGRGEFWLSPTKDMAGDGGKEEETKCEAGTPNALRSPEDAGPAVPL